MEKDGQKWLAWISGVPSQQMDFAVQSGLCGSLGLLVLAPSVTLWLLQVYCPSWLERGGG